MPQSISSVPLHIVFSTKSRENFINDDIAPNLHAYMSGVFKECDSPALSIGGTADHIHALALLSRTITIADLLREIKTASSKWMKIQSRGLSNVQWQKGYGVFGVSESKVSTVKAYIANQTADHRKSTFQDEFRALLKKHDMAFDEKFLWD